jgi:hypothetical protein
VSGGDEPPLLDQRMADGSRHFGDVACVRGVDDAAALRD